MALFCLVGICMKTINFESLTFSPRVESVRPYVVSGANFFEVSKVIAESPSKIPACGPSFVSFGCRELVGVFFAWISRRSEDPGLLSFESVEVSVDVLELVCLELENDMDVILVDSTCAV